MSREVFQAVWGATTIAEKYTVAKLLELNQLTVQRLVAWSTTLPDTILPPVKNIVWCCI